MQNALNIWSVLAYPSISCTAFLGFFFLRILQRQL